MGQPARTDSPEEEARLEQALDLVFKQMRDIDERMARRQLRIDRLREETLAIIAETKTLLAGIRAAR